MALPVNINQLINGKTVEWERLEFKEGWNPEGVLHTICAFANDINNWGGGYIILGIKAKNGQPTLPPKGLLLNQIDPIQKKLLEICNRIVPPFFPVAELAEFQRKNIFVIWVPGGDNRPYKAPATVGQRSQLVPWVRRFSSTKKANREEERQLLELAAKVPFDDRINHQAELDDLKLPRIQSFLQEIKSDLFRDVTKIPFADLCKQMNIARGPKEFLKPLNAGLLFFNNHPENFFQGAKIEIVEYKDDIGDEFIEKTFAGPIHQQLSEVLQYVKASILKEEVRKIPGKAKALRFSNYPYEAFEEALANAVYHRSYEDLNTIEVNIWGNRIEILSYPGPTPPVDNKQLKKPRVVARYYRNRRVGDFLKELGLTEGRATGIPKIRKAMKDNGSPPPRFETDKDRTYFLSVLPIHGKATILKEMVEVVDTLTQILQFCVIPKSRKEILEHIGLTNHPRNYVAHILPLLEKRLLRLTIPEKPTSSKQKYVITSKGSERIGTS